MAFSREDVQAYETKAQTQVDGFDPFNPSTTPVVEPQPQVEAVADADAAIAASLTDSDVPENNDGSTTETPEETVASNSANPEGAKDPNELDAAADGRGKSRAQERIEELVAERNALREYGKYLREQVESQRKTPVEAAPQAAQPQAKVEDAPTLEDAGFDPVKHSKMQNEWINKQVDKKVEQAVQQFTNRQTEQNIRSTFESRAAKFSEQAKDFQTIVSNPALPTLAREASKEILTSENGPAIAYHLGRNPDLATRISRMDPFAQVKALGRLEEQIVRTVADSTVTSKEPSNKPVPVKQALVTKAPPPPKPVTSGSGVIQKDVSLMDMDEFVANERNKKLLDRQTKQKMRASFGR